jgi:hypothetical protein
MRIQTRLVLPVLLFAAVISGCSDPCSIPLERSPRLRILNAMADQQQVDVFLNGTLVQPDLKYNPPITYTPAINQGYISTFLSGAPLPIGSEQKLVVLSTEGDTLLKQSIALSDRRQTMILIGRGRPRLSGASTPAKALMLDDQIASPVDGKTIARYVHAMPDLDTLDVYFANSATGRTPDVKIGYGEVTDYLELPAGVGGLLVTESGDTNNVVMKISQAFGLTGLFGTVVIRGSSDAHGTEPLPSPVVLSDRELGPALFSITSIFVRLVNGGREIPLSLFPKGGIDDGPRIDVAGQEKVFCIPRNGASEYWSITNTFHGDANWYFGTDCDDVLNDTFYVHNYHEKLTDLRRYTMAAVITSKLGVTPVTWDHLTILDTMSSPSGSTHGRVRFVNLSPDGAVTILTPTGNRTLQQGDIIYVDYPVGQPITAGGKTLTVTAVADDPKTVWFSAATTTDAVPYHVTED